MGTFWKGITALKLTIDSTEPLHDTLRVVGALYNVTLHVSGAAEAATPPAGTAGQASSAASTKPRESKARRPRKQTRRKRTRTGAGEARPAGNAAIRAWARENGYAVADRGRIPADVVAAYRQSHNND